MAEHRVSQGECLSSIAERYGFFWQTLWDHPDNEALRELRGDPNVLFPGDTVFVPDKRVAAFTRPTDARHTFKRKGVPALLRVQFLVEDEARANEPFVATIDGVEHHGTTDAEGVLHLPIRPEARRATVVFTNDGEEFELVLGVVDPVDTVTGAKSRLVNLGFELDAIDDQLDEQTIAALRLFQIRFGLDVTGELDDATRAKLLELHDQVDELPPQPDVPDPEDDFAPPAT
ncbi:MAG: peptidoglycan-binding protein [Sandaracinaceae bacterium]|nr:peptidoglycan-binding protein [Sandaracinaceae bacterium]